MIYLLIYISAMNLVNNGAFADGPTHWELCPLSTVVRDNGEERLIIEDTSREAGSDITSDAIPIEPGLYYTLGARLRYQGDSTALIYVGSYRGEQMLSRSGMIGTGELKHGCWHSVSQDLRCHPDADNVRLWIHSSMAAVGTYELTDITLHPAKEADLEEYFEKARKGHPRLYIYGENLDRIRENIRKDSNARKVSEILIRDAATLLDAEPISYEKTGKRMLGQARETLTRIKTLGMAYYLTGDEDYADAGVQVLMKATAIPHWNPSHYLDTAIMAFAVGLGYDWFYDRLSEAQRQGAVSSILEKGIAPSFMSPPWWLQAESNWNQVCNGGLGIACLAIWEAAPDVAARTIKRSTAGIPFMMSTYAPDGIYLEGPSYWAFGTTYVAQFIDALEGVMGTDFGLSEAPGFMESLQTINFLTGPTNRFLNFCDGHRYRSPQPVSYWFAKRLRDPDLLYLENALTEDSLRSGKYPDAALFLLWSDRAPREAHEKSACYFEQASERVAEPHTRRCIPAQPPEQLYWCGKGPQPIASFRNGWNKDALFAAMKGGISSGSHGHMDVGGFVIDAEGVRWASDIPSQSYTRAEDAKKKAEAEGREFEPAFYRDRWSHNILVVDGQSPVRGSFSPMIGFSDKSSNPHVIFDTSPAYEGQLAVAKRGMRFIQNKSVLVQDEFLTLDKPTTHIRWSMMTLNSPELDETSISDDGKSLVLRQSAKNLPEGQASASMEMRILSPANARFEVLVVNDQPYIHDYDRISDDARQVVIYLDVPANTRETLVVQFRPGPSKGKEISYELTPLEEWGG